MFIDANIFQPLIDVFEAVIKFFHDSVGVPWGWAIVLLTVAVRALLIPLTVKQFGSMQRMQQLGPQMKEIQKKYKDDKERQQQEMMRFYKENNVNPLGSCLPLVAQIPVFISLFYMLRTSLRIDICRAHQPLIHGVIDKAHLRPCGSGHGAGFLFISDLTNKATGVTLIVLIVLYVGSQLASSLMMSSPTMDRNQRMIMLFMPLFFVFFVINFPAGVLVYWITTNTWTMGQQFVIKRRIGPATAAAVATASATGPATGTSVVPSTRSGPKPKPRPPASSDEPTGNGHGTSGLAGLSGLIRGRGKSSDEGAPVATRPAGPPPKPPRKKKKRSGRRR